MLVGTVGAMIKYAALSERFYDSAVHSRAMLTCAEYVCAILWSRHFVVRETVRALLDYADLSGHRVLSIVAM